MRHVLLLMILSIALTVSGCGRGSSSQGDSTTSSSTPSSSGPSAATATGFGATKGDWLSAHKPAPHGVPGTGFLPMVKTDEGNYPKYAGVDLSTPVVSYTLNLPAHTSLREAEKIVLGEFPPGAKYDVYDRGQTACLIASIHSPLVHKSLKAHGWGNAIPVAAFGTNTAQTSTLDPNDVTDVTMLAESPPKGSSSNLGGC